jgi:hypothetical protein
MIGYSSPANLPAQGFLLQTPQDNGDLTWSFGASAVIGAGDRRFFKCILVYSSPALIDPSMYSWHIPHEWESTDLPLIVVPLTLLRLHVDQTSAKLTELIRRVEEIELHVLDSSAIEDFDPLIRALHACDADLIKLERRWNFERKLAAEVLRVIDRYKQPDRNYQDVQFRECIFNPSSHGNVNFNFSNSPTEHMDASRFQDMKPFKLLDSVAVLQRQRSHASEYDLGVLPRRIHNQFTAVGGAASTLSTHWHVLRCVADIKSRSIIL